MDLFDVPFMTIDRPSVFNINDFWPEKDLPWITEFIITTAYETEKESLAELTPDEFYPEIHNYVKGGREFLDALSNDVDIPDSGGKLFTIVGALITLIIRTELAFNHVLETQLSTDQKIKYVDDGLIITTNVFETVELKWWILGLGERIKVLKPKSLQKNIKKTITEAAKLYN